MIDAQKNAGTRCHSRYLLTRNKFLPSNIAAFSLVVWSTLLPASQTPVLAAHHACCSALFDSDDDGWGRENNRTCVVEAQAAPPTNTGTFGLPLCTDADSDPDGDGFGWEYDRSCLVVTTASAPQSAPAEPTNEQQATQPQDITADSLSFMAMGDSISHGVTRNSAKLYHYDLTDLLDAAGCRCTMVESQQTNLGHRTFVFPHEGYNGHRADHFDRLEQLRWQ